MVRFAAVESGGTTFRVAIAENHPSNIVEMEVFDTTNPKEVLEKCVNWLATRKFDALGVGSFGPIDLNPDSDHYGYITSTPKTLWRHVALLGPICEGLQLPSDFPVGFDTDVNAPALMEYAHAREKGEKIGSCAYVTVGTGVGIGLVFEGHPLHGLLHGEGGHQSVPRYPGDTFEGKKSLGCEEWYELESMVNTAAIAARAGCDKKELQDLPDEHPVWDLVAHYLASMCTNLILIASPERIVLGGGVLKRSILYQKIRCKTQKYLNNYIEVPKVTSNIDQLIVASDYGSRAGIVGCLHLAQRELEKKEQKEKTDQRSTCTSAFPFAAGVLAGVLVPILIGTLVCKCRK